MGTKTRDNFIEHKEFPLEAERLTHLSLLPVRDGSRLSTERIAPFFQHRMTDTTFVSSVDIGSVNLLRVHFHQIYTFFLKRCSQRLITES